MENKNYWLVLSWSTGERLNLPMSDRGQMRFIHDELIKALKAGKILYTINIDNYQHTFIIVHLISIMEIGVEQDVSN